MASAGLKRGRRCEEGRFSQSQSAVSYKRSVSLLVMSEAGLRRLPPVCPFVTQLGLTARRATGQEIGHHLSFALDCDHASVLQRVVIEAQDLVQVCSHLRTEGRRNSEWTGSCRVRFTTFIYIYYYVVFV